MSVKTSEGASAAAAVNSPNSEQGGDASTSGPISHPSSLTGKPLTVIQPRSSWVALNLRDVWAYRELLYFLTWRDVKVRYKQTVLGAAWAVLQPVFMMVIFTVIFGRFARLDQHTGGVPYSIWVYAGVLPWTFFAGAVSNSGNSLVGSANLITKVYFPRMVIPGAAVAAGLVDWAIAFVILIGLMLYYHVALTPTFLMVPVLMLVTTLLALAVGMWMSALNVKYRDIRYALPFIIQIGFYVSPIIWSPRIIPAKWHTLLALNPMAGIIDGFRAALFNEPFPWGDFGIASAITITFLVYAAYTFRSMERSFADLV